MILNILIAYGMLQAFFIALLLLRPADRTLFKRLFAALLIIEGITLFERLLVESDLIHHVPHLLGVSHPISFLKPPIMWFMALSLTRSNLRIGGKAYLHLIPFGLMLLMNVPFYFLSGPEKMEWVATFMNRIPSYQTFDFYFTLSFFAYIGIYIFLALRRLGQFRMQVANHALVNWYRIILLAYSGFLAIHLGYFLLQPLGQWNFALFNQVSMLTMTFIVQSIAFKLMDRSSLFKAKPVDLNDLQERKEQEELIIRQFEEGKAYRDEDLNLQQFAQTVSLPAAQVSRIINQRFNCSFTKLVARYRINEAKSILQNANGSKIKLIDVAYQVGFGNKVSFYRAFKELEQTSPSDYLEKVRAEEK